MSIKQVYLVDLNSIFIVEKLNLIFKSNIPCRSCKDAINGQFNNFKNNPPWVFIQMNRSGTFVQELSKILEIGGKKYQLLSDTILLNNHFGAVFLFK